MHGRYSIRPAPQGALTYNNQRAGRFDLRRFMTKELELDVESLIVERQEEEVEHWL